MKPFFPRAWMLLALLLGVLGDPDIALAVPSQVQPGSYGTTGCPSINLTPCFIPYATGNPLPVSISGGGGGTSGSFVSVNAVIAVTGTAVQVGTAATPNNGLSCFVISAGSNKVSLGNSASVTNPQSVAFGGSAVGTYLVNGQGWSAGINNANLLYINGTAGDGVTCWGN